MTITENIYTAKTHFSKLIQRALNGDEVIIAKAGKPLVCLIPFKERPAAKREPGTAKGKFEMTENFDEPLSEDILKDWEQ